jgi:4-amino-4-deoxy-L-arabinose transferase-like glycosyltransferase
MTLNRRYSVHLLILVRALMAGLLPLTADEAYYWLWSKHLDLGYLDHPPAIAFLIRAGTFLFGDTAFGVRMSGILLSGLATYFIFEAALLLLKNEARAVAAALLFNLTLMANVELLAATPDMPSTVTAAAFLFCLARLQDSGEGRWWLWAGVAAGLSLLSKFSALFLIAGAFLWLLLSPRQRPWLKTIWPWMGALLAFIIFLPNLIWQSSHHWETFAFQFGRVIGHQLTLRFMFEFLGAQLGLASPFLFVLGVAGLVRARRDGDLLLPAMLTWPALLYFFVHALHDRVQGNWPAFLYPAFVILAVSAFGGYEMSGEAAHLATAERGERQRSSRAWRRWCAKLAAPVAALFLIVIYVQALTGLLPLGRRDPLARLLGTGFRAASGSLATAAQGSDAAVILTTDYETTAWLRWYQPGLKVVQLGDVDRYPDAPAPGPDLAGHPWFYFVEQKRGQSEEVRQYFSQVSPATQFSITRNGEELSRYQIYRLESPKGPIPGRMP